jgi:hypothetical protein
MATVSITIPDTVAPDVYAALCESADLPTSAANAKTALINHSTRLTTNWRNRAAATSATTTATTQATTDLSGVV